MFLPTIVFGVPLEEVIERERAKGEDRAVPLIVEQIVQSLKSSPLVSCPAFFRRYV